MRPSVPEIYGNRGGSLGGGGSGGGGSGGSGSSGPRIKVEGSSSGDYVSRRYGDAMKMGKEFEEPEEYRDEEQGPKMKLELINLISDDEDEPQYTEKRNPRTAPTHGGLRPMRAPRVEQTVKQADTTNIKKEDDGEVEEPVPLADTPPQDAMDVDPSTPVADAPDDDKSTATESNPQSRASSLPRPSRNTSEEAQTRKSRQRPVFHTQQERQEYERHADDINVLREELGNIRLKQPDIDMDDKMDLDDTGSEDQKDGRLYLFSFPPLLPTLLNPASIPKPATQQAGQSDGDDDDGGDVIVTGEKVDLTKTPDTKPPSDAKATASAPEASASTMHSYVTEEGFVGKLIVRESGKVELDWGGTHLLLSRGAADNFSSSVVLAETAPTSSTPATGQPNTADEKPGMATGMGKVFGRFVITPDWERLF